MEGRDEYLLGRHQNQTDVVVKSEHFVNILLSWCLCAPSHSVLKDHHTVTAAPVRMTRNDTRNKADTSLCVDVTVTSSDFLFGF